MSEERQAEKFWDNGFPWRQWFALHRTMYVLLMRRHRPTRRAAMTIHVGRAHSEAEALATALSACVVDWENK